MKNEPFVIERTYNAPIQKVWKALTDRNEMQQWYFNLKEFKPEVGFEFEFNAPGKDGVKQFTHQCRITTVNPGKKIAYTWKYKGYEGNSEVSFELFDEGNKTRLKLTHSGLETFPQNDDFAKENFVQGWTFITGTSLKNYLGKTGST